MYRKLAFVIVVVLLVAMAGTASAAPVAFTWTNTGGDADWCNAANWDPAGGPPGDNDPCDTVTIPGNIPRGPKIGAGCDVTVASISGPDPAADTHVVVDINTGGKLFIHDTWTYSGGSDSGVVTVNIHGELTIDPDGSESGDQIFRAPDNGTGYVNVYAPANIYLGGEDDEGAFRGADNDDSWYYVTMYGGDVNCGKFKLGDNGSGDFIMTGGTWVTRETSGESFTIRGRNEGTFFEVRIDGGAQLYIAGSLRTPQEDAATALINIDDGYLECKEWDCAGENWVCDINEGMIRIKDPEETNIVDIQGWIDDGQITGYNNTVTPIVTKDGDDYVVTNSFLHLKAYDESPVDRSTNICPTNVELSWTPGIYAQNPNDCNIYFGPDNSDVNESATPVRVGHDTNTWTPPGPLELGETYYWRVDIRNDACETSPWEGGIWEFQIDNGQARNPSPPDGLEGVAYADVSPLTWTPSCVADKHKVYWGVPGNIVLFSDNFNDGFDPDWDSTTGWSIFDGNSDPNRFDPHDNNLAKATAGTLESKDIDTNDANSIDVRFFILLAKGVGAGAVTLNYYNGATYVPVADWNALDPCEVWIEYDETTTDSQYLNISDFRIQLVSTLTGPNSVYINNVRVRNNWPVAAEYYAGETSDANWPVTVEAWKNYSWRIDTNTTGGQIVKGDHWDFATGYGGLLLYYKFDAGPEGASLADPITDSTGDYTFDTYDGGGALVYGESNPIIAASSWGADFDPNMGLHRFDPCGPDEIDPLRLSGYQHTVELWVKPERLDDDMDTAEDDPWTDDDDDICLIGKHDQWGIWIAEPGDNDTYRFYQDGNGESLDNDLAVVDEWAHLALVYDQTAEDDYMQYLNGELMDSTDEGTNDDDSNYPVTIGYARMDDVNLGRFFDGVIDEVRIHDIALRPCDFLLIPGTEYARCPEPEDSEGDIDPCGVVLYWEPGSEATSHDVYFSTDYDEVDTMDPAALVGDDLPDPCCPVGDLKDGELYWWKVVENGGGGPYEGVPWNFTTTYVIEDETLRVWYEFGETSGDRAFDHSGHGFHVDGADNQWDTAEGRCYPGSLFFDDDIGLLPSMKIFETVTNKITVACWLKGKVSQTRNKDLAVFGSGSSIADYRLDAYVPDEYGDVYFRAGNDTNDVLVWSEATPRGWENDWHHMAFVKDEPAGEMKIYFDGFEVDSKKGAIPTLSQIRWRSIPFKIGAKGTETASYEGNIDDFRIYNRVLTDTEIASLFRCGDLDAAWAPDPYDGQPDALSDPNLTWKPGDHAADHNVYFGTSKSQVENMVDPCATKPLGQEFYDVGPLTLNTTYYWRVDEHNDTNEWTGPIWRFKVADYVVIDDFESYKETGDTIQDAWCDGAACQTSPFTGSHVELAIEEHGKPVNTLKQAMKYNYNTNDPFACGWYGWCYAEAWLPYDPPMDWTQSGVRILRLYFYGQEDNDANEDTQMYICVEDSVGELGEVRYGDNGEDMNDLNEEFWHEWDVPLSLFEANDVDLNDVNRFYIGFGNRNAPAASGSGTVYFDDIRLNLPICIPELSLEWDLDDNCEIGMGDVGEMVQVWLAGDVNFADLGIEIEEPCDANLGGYYELDGDANDSSDNDYDGTLEGTYEFITGKIGPYAVHFAGGSSGGSVEVEDNNSTPGLRPAEEVTICAWIRRTESTGGDTMHVAGRGGDDKETYALEINQGNQGLTFLVRDANKVEDDGDPMKYSVDSEDEVPRNEWLHVAGTYDGNELTSYINGEVLLTFTPGPNELYADVNDGFRIAGRWDDDGGKFPGDVDDVRVYDYGLSQAEIAWIATEGSGEILLDSEANFVDGEDPEVINLRDLAELLSHWGEKKYWP